MLLLYWHFGEKLIQLLSLMAIAYVISRVVLMAIAYVISRVVMTVF
jgi:hypothetical protein